MTIEQAKANLEQMNDKVLDFAVVLTSVAVQAQDATRKNLLASGWRPSPSEPQTEPVPAEKK